MKRKDYLELNEALVKVGEIRVDDPKLVDFAFAVAKNRNRLKEEVEAVKVVATPIKGYMEYEKERNDLCQELAVKDKDGKPKMIGNNYDIPDADDEKSVFQKRLKKLQEAHKNSIKLQEEATEKVNQLLEEEITIDLVKIKKENIPTGITGNELANILMIIE